MNGELIQTLGAAIHMYPKQRVPIYEVMRLAKDLDPSLVGTSDQRDRVLRLLVELRDDEMIEFARTAVDVSEYPALPGFVVARADAPDRQQPAPYPWRAELAWAAYERLTPREETFLKRIQRFLREDGSAAPDVPIKERSYQLCDGSEKALEQLARGRFFREGRLTLQLLRCHRVNQPFSFLKVNPAGSVLLVSENASTQESFSRLLSPDGPVAAVAFGAGMHFVQSVAYASDLPFHVRRILYMGDLDAKGLRIPTAATLRAAEEKLQLPPVEPVASFYRCLLRLASPALVEGSQLPLPGEIPTLVDWLPLDLREQAAQVLESNHRLAQEAVGYQYLSSDPTCIQELERECVRYE
jgi:hypothetical protein